MNSNDPDHVSPLDINTLLANAKAYRAGLDDLRQRNIHPSSFISKHRSRNSRAERFVDEIIAVGNVRAENNRAISDDQSLVDLCSFNGTVDFLRHLHKLKSENISNDNPVYFKAFVALKNAAHSTYYDVKIHQGKVSLIAEESAGEDAAENILLELNEEQKRFPDLIHNASVIVTNMQKSASGCDIFAIDGAFKSSRARSGIEELHKQQLSDERTTFALISDQYGNILDWTNYVHSQSKTQTDAVIDNPKYSYLLLADAPLNNKKHESFLTHHFNRRVKQSVFNLKFKRDEIREFSNSIDLKRIKHLDRLIAHLELLINEHGATEASRIFSRQLARVQVSLQSEWRSSLPVETRNDNAERVEIGRFSQRRHFRKIDAAKQAQDLMAADFQEVGTSASAGKGKGRTKGFFSTLRSDKLARMTDIDRREIANILNAPYKLAAMVENGDANFGVVVPIYVRPDKSALFFQQANGEVVGVTAKALRRSGITDEQISRIATDLSNGEAHGFDLTVGTKVEATTQNIEEQTTASSIVESNVPNDPALAGESLRIMTSLQSRPPVKAVTSASMEVESDNLFSLIRNAGFSEGNSSRMPEMNQEESAEQQAPRVRGFFVYGRPKINVPVTSFNDIVKDASHHIIGRLKRGLRKRDTIINQANSAEAAAHSQAPDQARQFNRRNLKVKKEMHKASDRVRFLFEGRRHLYFAPIINPRLHPISYRNDPANKQVIYRVRKNRVIGGAPENLVSGNTFLMHQRPVIEQHSYVEGAEGYVVKGRVDWRKGVILQSRNNDNVDQDLERLERLYREKRQEDLARHAPELVSHNQDLQDVSNAARSYLSPEVRADNVSIIAPLALGSSPPPGILITATDSASPTIPLSPEMISGVVSAAKPTRKPAIQFDMGKVISSYESFSRRCVEEGKDPLKERGIERQKVKKGVGDTFRHWYENDGQKFISGLQNGAAVLEQAVGERGRARDSNVRALEGLFSGEEEQEPSPTKDKTESQTRSLGRQKQDFLHQRMAELPDGLPEHEYMDKLDDFDEEWKEHLAELRKAERGKRRARDPVTEDLPQKPLRKGPGDDDGPDNADLGGASSSSMMHVVVK